MGISTDERLVLRLPRGVRGVVQTAAKQDGRSMNGQIVRYVLQGLRLDGFDLSRDPKENARAVGAARASVSQPTQ